MVPRSEDYQLLVESVHEYALILLDHRGTVVSWNRGAEVIYGYAAREALGRPVATLYIPEDVANNLPALHLERARDAGHIEIEGARLRKDGARLWASVVITALRDATGELRGFAKIAHDVSHRRSAEEELGRSEERFRLLIEAVRDYAIYMLDTQGNVTSWNSGAQKIKGYSAAEIVGKNFSLFFPQLDVEQGKPQRELEIARSEGRFEQEAYRVRKDGSRFWANVVVTPIRDADNTLLGFAKVTRDLTDRLSAEQTARELIREQAARIAAEAAEARVRESELRYRVLSDRLQMILEGVGHAVTVQDADGRVIYANTAAAVVNGFETVGEYISAEPRSVLARFEFSDESRTTIAADSLPAERVLRGEPPISMRVRMLDRERAVERWYLLRATAVYAGDGRPELAITALHDITDDQRREQRERYLANATAALSESLDASSLLRRLAEELSAGMADWCAIHLLEGDSLEAVAVAHADAAKREWARSAAQHLRPDRERPRGLWEVARSGRSQLLNDLRDVTEGLSDPAQRDTLFAAGVEAALIVPISVRGRVLGTILLVSSEAARHYDHHDLTFAEELGRRAGTSIENARLYAAEKIARDQLALLARAGESFAAATSYEEMVTRVVDIALPTLGDFAFFDVIEGAKIRRITSAPDDRELLALLNETTGPRSDRPMLMLPPMSGQSALYPSIDRATLSELANGPEQLAWLRKLAPCSLVTVALRARDELLGSLTVCFGKSGRRHTADDLKLTEELARRAAISLVQVRLYARAQDAARRAAEAAQRAEEANRVKDEFLATVSHELRTPLNAIVGWSSLLRTKNPDPAVTKGIEVIHRNAVAQGKIIEDILDMSRIITGKLRLDVRPTDFANVVQNAIEVVRPSALARDLTLDFVPPRDRAVLMADPDRLQQVVWNLLSNAVKFSHPGGSIHLRMNVDLTQIILSVRDTGRGIDPDFLPFVFDRFKQADSSTTRRFGGLGLGLAIVRQLVELHGGQVEAVSDGPDQGATFNVTLPVRSNAIPKPPDTGTYFLLPSAPMAQQKELENVKVLVVDDDLDARELVHTLLTEAGAVVETAASAAEGMAALTRARPDVLVSDIGMPDEDGYSFVQRVNALHGSGDEGLPSLALTAYTRGQDRAKALSMGFDAHLGKPVNPVELIATIRRLARAAT